MLAKRLIHLENHHEDPLLWPSVLINLSKGIFVLCHFCLASTISDGPEFALCPLLPGRVVEMGAFVFKPPSGSPVDEGGPCFRKNDVEMLIPFKCTLASLHWFLPLPL
jgi:hypothetical protein